MSLYTEDVKKFLRSRDWPKGLVWEVVELEKFLRFRLFRENINALDGVDKLRLAKLLNDTLLAIHRTGIPIYIEVGKGDGRREG